ncbi:hypothetical protein [Krasilnikovia sp. M28-CT-15]|uniref:hypothetical protein n=1 Tax=Krasilnikovia sp. M28-CT-15 TaxID=3373540 RepID=UPI00399C9B3F
MARLVTAANTGTRGYPNDRLHTLVTRIAAGDRAAFRTVYAFLVMRVWRDALRLLPSADARAVTRSTFVEMWHLAGHHRDHEGRGTAAWIRSIAARHIEDRPPTTNGGQPLQCAFDHHTLRELISLLGPGRGTIRTAPATFTRVVDLCSMTAIRDAWLVERHHRHHAHPEHQSPHRVPGTALAHATYWSYLGAGRARRNRAGWTWPSRTHGVHRHHHRRW